jgi:lysophospholipase L1-like esterase
MRHHQLGFVVAVLMVLGATSGVGACGPGTPTTAATANPTPPGNYVALGDSYASGPGIPAASGVPLGCARSSNNYPALVAAATHYRQVHDVSCSGATTTAMLHPQPTLTGANPPQLDALSAQTTLVTLTVGANDIGFTGIAACLAHDRDTNDDTATSTCRSRYRTPTGDLLAQRIAATAPKVAAIIAQVHHRAPAAVVLIVGYPTVLSPGAASCAELPLSASDRAYYQQTFDTLDSMLQRQAGDSRAQFINTATSSTAHSICAAPGTRWIEGLHPSSPAAPFHPNAAGMLNSATQILHALHSRDSRRIANPTATAENSRCARSCLNDPGDTRGQPSK